MTGMVYMAASEFKAKCLEILDHVPPEGLVITKRGRPVAHIYPESQDPMRFHGSIPDLEISGDIFSTGLAWESE